MTAQVVPARFALRRRTAAAWAALNEVLHKGEPGVEIDTGFGKSGDGVTAWNDLDYELSGHMDMTGLADGKCMAWDAARGLWAPANRGAVYQQGSGIAIDSTDPESPIISSTLGSIALSGRVATYSALPSGLGSGNSGDAYYVEADGLVYIWSGTAFPASGSGVRTNGLMAMRTLSSSATSISVSGLNLNRDLTYRFVASLKNSGGTASNIGLYFNSDLTASNYRRSIASAPTASGNVNTNGSTADATVAGLNASGVTSFMGDVCLDAAGSARTIANSVRDTGASLQLQVAAHVWSGTANVTSITCAGSVSNSLAAGSFLAVYRM